MLGLSITVWWVQGWSASQSELRSLALLESSAGRVAELLEGEQNSVGHQAAHAHWLITQLRDGGSAVGRQAPPWSIPAIKDPELRARIADLQNALTRREPEQIRTAYRAFMQTSTQYRNAVLKDLDRRRQWVAVSLFVALVGLLAWGYWLQHKAQRQMARTVVRAQSWLSSMLDGALIVDSEGTIVAQNAHVTHRNLLPGICIGANLLNFLSPMLEERSLVAMREDLFALFEDGSNYEPGARLRSVLVELNATSTKKSTQYLELKLSKCQWVSNEPTVDDWFVLMVVDNVSEHIETQRTLESAMRLQKSRPHHVVKALYSVPNEVRRYLARSKMTEHDLRHALNAHENDPSTGGETVRTMDQFAKSMLAEAKAINLELFVEAWSIFIEIYKTKHVKNVLEERVLMRLQAKLDDIHMLRKSLEALMPMMVAAHSYREQYGHDIKLGDFAAIEQMSHDLVDAYASFSESFTMEEALAKTVNPPSRAKTAQPPRTLRDYLTAISERVAAREGKKIEIFFKGLDSVDAHHPYFELLSKVGEELLANSIEHGLEIELDRILTHKERLGRIDVELYERDRTVCLSVRDDGRGLDFTQIRSTAIARGLLDARNGEVDRGTLLRCVFAEGFSTEQVDEERARPERTYKGAGLSHVKVLLKSSGGKVSVRSVDGQYCQFKVKLPSKV